MMKKHVHTKTILLLTLAMAGISLTGCGSSSQEEQLTWMAKWKNDYQQNMQMLNVCFKEAGVRSMTQQLSEKQSAVINECEIDYITDVAQGEGVSLDSETIKNNIIQL